MKCDDCGKLMKSSRGNHHFLECGLPNVFLVDVGMATCPSCGRKRITIPNLSGLHRAIAQVVSRKLARLNAKEIRFLRKHLGFSGADFARHMGVTASQVSRWENAREVMGSGAERLLRLLVANQQPVENFPVDLLAQIGRVADSRSAKFRLKSRPDGSWHPAAA